MRNIDGSQSRAKTRDIGNQDRRRRKTESYATLNIMTKTIDGVVWEDGQRASFPIGAEQWVSIDPKSNVWIPNGGVS